MIGETDDDDDVGFAWSGRWRRRDLRGRSINDGNFSSTDMGLRRALSPTFPAGELVFFIPWRVVAENPARRVLLLDLPGPAAPSISIF